MIATTRGLAVLAGIAAGLLVLLLLAGPRAHGPVDRSLLPGFDATKVTAISFTHGQAVSTIQRVGTAWRIDDPPGVADPATVDAMFTALRGGRWHRRAPSTAAGLPDHPHAITRTTINGVSFLIGKQLPGTGQTWIVRTGRGGDEALLVDSWIADALSPGPLELRVRHPLDCSSASSLAATTSEGSIRIEGRRLVEPRPLWIDERWLSGLADACSRIEIVGLDGRAEGAPGLTITADDSKLVQSGRCSDNRQSYVDTSSGPGCVDSAALRDLHDAIEALRGTPYGAIDLRPLPIAPVKVTLSDGSVLDVTGKPRIKDADADPDAVRELVRALTARGESAVPRPAQKPTATIKAVDGAGTEVTLELFADQTIGRAGEPGVIRVQPRNLAIIARPAAALRDTTRWREDPTTISSITLDNVTYKRGAVLGEWTREPAGAVDPALVDALVDSLGSVRAPAAAPPRAIAHRLTVTITPPAGAPTTHAIEFAPPAGDGCPARIDGEPVQLPLPLCTAALAVAAQH